MHGPVYDAIECARGSDDPDAGRPTSRMQAPARTTAAASLRGLDPLPRVRRSFAIGDGLGKRACMLAVFPLE